MNRKSNSIRHKEESFIHEKKKRKNIKGKRGLINYEKWRIDDKNSLITERRKETFKAPQDVDLNESEF
jgi:hypothetical protein